MKPDIHPTYGEATVTCSCGNTFTTESTKSTLRVELSQYPSNGHVLPLFVQHLYSSLECPEPHWGIYSGCIGKVSE